MQQLKQWSSIVVSALAIAAGGLANVACNGIDCGQGTIEQNGTCVPSDDNPGSAQCGPGTVLAPSGKCEPEEVVVCDPDTTTEQVDPETGVVTCVGTGTTTGCTMDLPCTAPSAGKITICGRIYDTQTDQVVSAMNATGAPCMGAPTATGPCSLRVQFFDALEFAMGPTTATPQIPAGGLTVDDCGRFRAIDLPEASFGFMGIAVDDGMGNPDSRKLTGVALPNAEALPARGFHAYTTRNETDVAWSTSAGNLSPTYATRGVLAAVFDYNGMRMPNVQVRRNSQNITNDDYYFSDTNDARSTVDTALTRTGANGTALVINSPSPVNHDGVGGAIPGSCNWPNNLAASIPGVVFVQIKEARTTGGALCP